jgi:hypothetical protein
MLPSLARLNTQALIGALLENTDPDIRDDDCAFCLEPLRGDAPSGGTTIEALNSCPHQYHEECFTDFVASRGDPVPCPLCRVPVDAIEIAAIRSRIAADFAAAGVGSPCELAHGPGWDTATHYSSLGAYCGQNCPCCRYQVEGPGGFGICTHCLSCGMPRTAPAAILPVVRAARKSFLFVICKNLGFVRGRAGQTGPHLLLLGHYPPPAGRRPPNDPTPVRRWGVPGGMREERRDRDTLDNVVREFLEEMGLVRHPLRAHLEQTRAIFAGLPSGLVWPAGGPRSALKQVVRTNNHGYSAWSLVVNTALDFELAVGLSTKLRRARTGHSVEAKYNLPLSAETKGYTWVPLQAGWPYIHRDRTPSTPTQRSFAITPAPRQLNFPNPNGPSVPRPLRLRQGTLGRAMQRAVGRLR